VENLFAALPPAFAADIDEFVLSNFDRWPEPLTYLPIAGRRRVEFFMTVRDKTPATTDRALREFLRGIARMQADSKLDRPLDRSERREYEEFIATWLPAGQAALGMAAQPPAV
jgi:hypothetical protein